MKTDHGERTLTLLGTKGGPALRTPGASFLPTSNLLSLGHRKIIIDCGIGVTQALARAGHSASAITDIFITHLHSDHAGTWWLDSHRLDIGFATSVGG